MTEHKEGPGSLWTNPQYPPPALQVLPVEQWDFFELAGHLLKTCLAKYSIEQQRKVGEFAKTLVNIAEMQRTGSLKGASVLPAKPEPAACEVLTKALIRRTNEYSASLDHIRGVIENDPESYDHTVHLREALELTRCLRRLVPHCSLAQIHQAFGAPGDFGYESVIGDALARLYRGEP